MRKQAPSISLSMCEETIHLLAVWIIGCFLYSVMTQDGVLDLATLLLSHKCKYNLTETRTAKTSLIIFFDTIQVSVISDGISLLYDSFRWIY